MSVYPAANPMFDVIRMGGALRSLACIGIAPGSGIGTAVIAGDACAGRKPGAVPPS